MLKKVIREKDKEKLDMNVFKELGKDLNYKDILQVDGAFSACHINYGKSLKFNGADSKNMAQNSRKNSLTENGHIDDLEAVQYDFNGTEKDFKKQEVYGNIFQIEVISDCRYIVKDTDVKTDKEIVHRYQTQEDAWNAAMLCANRQTFDLSVKIPGSVHMSVNYKEQTISVIGSDNQLKRLYKVTTDANQS